jgi:tRNA(Ile)-lysidine synthetase-like protein
MKRLLGILRNTIEENNLIENGDIIGVGISGGKDSMSLLYELKKYQSFSPIDFKVHALKINIGFEEEAANDRLREFCKSIGVELTIEYSDIKTVVFDIKEEKNPCALCANMRRGALATLANRLGIKKIALGHHKDDKIETFFMNMFYSGRLNTFQMKSYLSRSEVTIIRPFYEVEESLIKTFVKKYDIPVIPSNCVVDKETKREEIKGFLSEIYPRFKGSKRSIESAIKNEEQFNLF